MRRQEMEAQTERIISGIFKEYEKPMTSEDLNVYVGYAQGTLDTLHALELITDSRYDKLYDKNYDLYMNKENIQ